MVDRLARLGTLVAALLLAACAPDTDLTAIPSDFGGPGGSGAPAVATLVDPAPGAMDVPVNLAAVLVRFPGAVVWGSGLSVCAGPAGPVAAATPAEIACEGGVCYRVALQGPLPGGAPCQVELGEGNSDGTGAVLPAGVIGIFDTAAAADDAPPLLSELTVSVSGPCLSVSFSTDEPASGTVTVTAAGVAIDGPVGVGQTRFEVAIPLGPLPPASAATVVVGAVDRAGNLVMSAPLAFETPAPLPPLVITEVMENAAGPEPAQEYVELRNLGTDAVPLAGLRIQDAKGGDELPAQTLAAGGYALVVPSGYDPAQGQDPAPRAGTLLVRVDARLGADGLTNSGEVVKLMLGDTVVSSYGGWVDVSASRWAGKGVHRLVQSACDRADAWNRTPLEATPGAGPP